MNGRTGEGIMNHEQPGGRRSADGWRIVPDDERQCIWMQEGILEYKLCDRGYECENCPLDRQLRVPPLMHREQSAPPTTGYLVRVPDEEQDPDIRRLLSAFRAFELRPDHSYTRDHLWFTEFSPAEYRFGIDDFHARLLPSRFTIVLTTAGSRVGRGDIIGWIQANSQTIHLRAPIAGTLSALNTDLIHDPALLQSSPYEQGWIGRITAASRRRPRKEILTAREMEDILPREAHLLCRTFISKLASGASLGPTMHDGGLPVRRLDEALGLHAYVDAIRNFLDARAYKHQ
jgi:glycine cleavage system H protein